MKSSFETLLPRIIDNYCSKFGFDFWDRDTTLVEMIDPYSVLREDDFEEPSFFIQNFRNVSGQYVNDKLTSFLFVCSRIQNTEDECGLEKSICISLIRSGDFVEIDRRMDLFQERDFESFSNRVIGTYGQKSTYEGAQYISMRLYKRDKPPGKILTLPERKVLTFSPRS